MSDLKTDLEAVERLSPKFIAPCQITTVRSQKTMTVEAKKDTNILTGAGLATRDKNAK